MLESLFESCGYLATFLGTLLEGEFSLITSVLGSKMGYYNFMPAMIAAFAGAWVADWFKFIVGNTKGQKLLNKRPKMLEKFNRVTSWFEKHPYILLTFYKFFFGFTTIILLVAGMRGVSYWRFAIHTGISIILWIGVIGGLAFHCSEVLTKNLMFLTDHKLEFLAGVSITIFLYWFFFKRPYVNECLDCEPKEEIELAK